MKGILDRFEGDKAVILVEDLEKEIIVPRKELPDGVEVNTYFTLDKDGDTFQIVAIDQSKTDSQAQKSSELMEKLRSKKKGSKFKKQ
ncbi:DUF3006 domain-containing protein [Oceanobacillus halophilus]|uniref:DUF3006 domain-containing protein n=1 Tax=Oceanobacillus halophilus TaxID=930130 RepID=A0A495A959_9BACI|nr:DUF3006 domain-containing protein [Oceanobacillus halophilus]RKQ35831.1 DUF3006 domain-containing protein [Oceanobacillus halophilus]